MSTAVRAADTGGTPPSRTDRLVVALAIGVGSGLVCWLALTLRPQTGWAGADFGQTWLAARYLVAGQNPYAHVRIPMDGTTVPWYYPLPAAFAALPFVHVSANAAAVLFVALSSFFAVYFLWSHRAIGLHAFLSPVFVVAIAAAQWSPFVVAALLAPGVGQGLLVLKPTVGLAVFAYRPTWKGAFGGALLLIVATALVPSWPLDWYHVARGSPFAHSAAFLLPLGPLLVLAALRWRRPEARLLLAMALVPHTLFWYDELPLWLIPASRREALNLTWCSWAGYLAWQALSYARNPDTLYLRTGAPWLVAAVYLPCLVMVLRRPNEGAVPVWVDRCIGGVWSMARRAVSRRTGMAAPGE